MHLDRATTNHPQQARRDRSSGAFETEQTLTAIGPLQKHELVSGASGHRHPDSVALLAISRQYWMVDAYSIDRI